MESLKFPDSFTAAEYTVRDDGTFVASYTYSMFTTTIVPMPMSSAPTLVQQLAANGVKSIVLRW